MGRGKNCVLLSLSLVVIVIMSTAWVEVARSQAKYPTKPITIVVPYPPGGMTDVIQRMAAASLSKRWGVPVNVLNKSGGMAIPACLEVYQSPPDGYTFYADSTQTSLMSVVVKDLPFKVMDRTFVSRMVMSPMSLVVSPKSPFKTMKDLEVEVKKNPGAFTWATYGGAGVLDIPQRQWFKAIGVDYSKTKPVMIQGGPHTAQMIGGGHIMMGFVSLASGGSTLRGGIVRPLAVASKKRDPGFPEIPTTGEQGYPTVITEHWEGTSGPPNMPLPIVAVWEEALQDFLKDPETVSKLKNVPITPDYLNSRDFREFVRKQIEEVAALWSVK
jgi:tripartite-type tricarboxylate transporter receptor subunit TctC